MSETLEQIKTALSGCRLCETRFAATATGHRPNPVVWFDQGARILVAGQAPGIRVHEVGKPFFDQSGDRLRAWMGVSADQFYDRSIVAALPMAFCFPGYDAKGADLPPPPLCRATWHDRIMTAMGGFDLILLIGGYAQKYHLGPAANGGVTRTVAGWRDHAPLVFPLPHPSWRNTAWLRKNPWFDSELLPQLRTRVQEVIHG
ncbi:uracil-DNA glycosylase family protein [Actibacterium sp.]|uniref:uracil-DNA glycosylase family protein n=1 Tax=Actibacterium sp. TaxID=1872125 RepID=UPI00356AC64E